MDESEKKEDHKCKCEYRYQCSWECKCQPNCQCSPESKSLFELQYQHAWNYFSFHANQRIILFGHYIIFFSIFAAGAGCIFFKFLHSGKTSEIIGIIIALLFIGITEIFHLLDQRNRDLVNIAKNKLLELEEDPAFRGKRLNIFTEAQMKTETLRHTILFELIFNGGKLLGLAYIILALYSCIYPLSCEDSTCDKPSRPCKNQTCGRSNMQPISTISVTNSNSIQNLPSPPKHP